MTEVPSILDIQVLIEKAWDHGILSESRIQTGGILKSRKYIGTPEVRPSIPASSHIRQLSIC